MSRKYGITHNPGAGGNWLAYLIYVLRDASNAEIIQLPTNHFERYPQNLVLLEHIPTEHNFPVLYLSGFCKFNFFVNSANKYFQVPRKINLEEKIPELIKTAQFQFLDYEYDLDYSLIFCDPESFLNNLYSWLAAHDIAFHKKTEVALRLIDNFKKTCDDPRKYIGSANVHWLTWSAGILAMSKKDFIGQDLYDIDIEDIRKQVQRHQPWLIDFTNSVSLFV